MTEWTFFTLAEISDLSSWWWCPGFVREGNSVFFHFLFFGVQREEL